MKARLLNYWEGLRTSYWFVPSLMALVAIGLAVGIVAVDRMVLEFRQLAALRWLYNGNPEGARQLLSTVAGSMITVAGVTFSITIVALTLASSQFGPRLLHNFMRDPINQVVLGTFIATFLYCLLVLGSVRGVQDSVFIPHIAVSFAILLAVANIGVLIFFIHHVSTSIRAQTVIDRVAQELYKAIETIFPGTVGEGAANVDERVEPPLALQDDEAETVTSQQDGYIVGIDDEKLMTLAQQADLLLRLDHRPGDFVVQQQPLLSAWPAGRLDDSQRHKIHEAFLIGPRRTPPQDVEFMVLELVEVAVRALSPGINDPFTAIACVDHLGAALCKLARREIPSPYRYDDAGHLRLIQEPYPFSSLLDAAFDQIRQHARDEVAVTLRQLEALRTIATCTDDPQRGQAILRQATMIERASQEAIPDPWDRADITRCFHEVVAAVDRMGQPEAATDP